MHSFSNIKELLSALYRGEKLLTEMFKKRNSTAYKYEYALDLEDHNPRKIKHLIDREVIRKNGENLEIDQLYLHFFEQVLEANEEINTAYVHENIRKVKQNIEYFFNEKNEQRKYKYLRTIKRTFRNIGRNTLRNVIDLQRNIDNTYKNEPNYKNKKAKLENFDAKRKDIQNLIEQTERLIDEDDLTFFKTATDEELNEIIINLKKQLGRATHNLIDIEKQIIAFLNQIQEQSSFLEKLRQIKYLKDQFTLESSTDIKKVLAENKAVVFEPKPSYPLKLSLSFLHNSDEALSSIQKIARQKNNSTGPQREVAEEISQEYLETQPEEEIFINLEEVKNAFLAGSHNLFDFVQHYDFKKTLSFEEKVTIYCQLISQYENLFQITEDYAEKESIEYAVIYPK